MPKPKTVKLQTSVTDVELTAIQRAASATGHTVASWLRWTIQQAIQGKIGK